jgi:GNAT superfamily N-acetyltransferase
MVYEMHRHHIELLRFAVAPDKRRRGVATSMMARLTMKLGNVRNRIYIDVPERLLAFQLFLKACRIPCLNINREGYGETYEFEYRFNPAAAEAAMLQ